MNITHLGDREIHTIPKEIIDEHYEKYACIDCEMCRIYRTAGRTVRCCIKKYPCWSKRKEKVE